MTLLTDKYDVTSVEKFMVIFPGKTKDTLNKLISELESKERLMREKSGKVENSKCSLGKFVAIFL